jgi:hypothetical protein
MAAPMEGEVGKGDSSDEYAWDGREEVFLLYTYHYPLKPKVVVIGSISLLAQATS